MVLASLAVHAQDIEITSLASNGQLTFSNSFTNGLFTIRWAPNLPCTNWNESWDPLKYFIPTGSVTTVSVPMFYRVTCLTNQFIPTPIGRQFIYTVTNADGSTNTLQATFIGCLKLTSDKDYSILEFLTPCAVSLLPCRSTATAFYDIPFDISTTEGLTWRSGSPGTMWTNQWCDGSSDQMTIVTNEVITVPAGAFDCLKIEEREINNNLNLRHVWWVKPGFMMVRQFDIKNGGTNVSSLASWADRAPR